MPEVRVKRQSPGAPRRHENVRSTVLSFRLFRGRFIRDADGDVGAPEEEVFRWDGWERLRPRRHENERATVRRSGFFVGGSFAVPTGRGASVFRLPAARCFGERERDGGFARCFRSSSTDQPKHQNTSHSQLLRISVFQRFSVSAFQLLPPDATALGCGPEEAELVWVGLGVFAVLENCLNERMSGQVNCSRKNELSEQLAGWRVPIG